MQYRYAGADNMPPELSSSDATLVAALARCVARHRATSEYGELEVRLGSVDVATSHFSCGVTRSIFEQLERDMVDASTLRADVGWKEVVDYYYTDAQGRAVRSRVEFDSTTMEMHTTHIRKEVIDGVLVHREDDARDACRLTMAVEHPVDDLPFTCMVNHVRVKQRRCFTDERVGCTAWVFELSKTWSANSREAVEYQQHNTEPNYEVECELVDEDRAYSAERTDQEVARSLLLKIKLLLGDEEDARLIVAHGENGDMRRGARHVRKRKNPPLQ